MVESSSCMCVNFPWFHWLAACFSHVKRKRKRRHICWTLMRKRHASCIGCNMEKFVYYVDGERSRWMSDDISWSRELKFEVCYVVVGVVKLWHDEPTHTHKSTSTLEWIWWYDVESMKMKQSSKSAFTVHSINHPIHRLVEQISYPFSFTHSLTLSSHTHALKTRFENRINIRRKEKEEVE